MSQAHAYDAYNEEIGDQVAAICRARGHVAYSGVEWRRRRMPSGPPKLMALLGGLDSVTVAPCARANLSSGRPRSVHRAPARTSSNGGDDPHPDEPALGRPPCTTTKPARRAGALAWSAFGPVTQSERRFR